MNTMLTDRRRRIPSAPALAAYWVALFFLGACADEDAVEEETPLETVTVERGNLAIIAEAAGEVEPIREVEVKSKASGEILSLRVDVGDDVEPGALLASIDPRDVQNDFNQAEADLAVAQTRMEITRSQSERADRLVEESVITPQEHESSRLDFANAQANLVKAETTHQLAQLRLNDVRIRAPMAGTIIQKNVEEGSVIQSASGNVSGGTTLFIMANLREMQVRTLVDETDMGQLQAGMEASVTVEAFDERPFPGRVDKIEPQAEVIQNVTMFPVIISIDNSSGLLKPGMNANVTIFVDEANNVVLVPNGAIVQVGDVGPAALALGLNPDDIDMRQFMGARFAGMGGFGGGEGGGGMPAGATAGAGAGAAGSGGGAAPPRNRVAGDGGWRGSVPTAGEADQAGDGTGAADEDRNGTGAVTAEGQASGEADESAGDGEDGRARLEQLREQFASGSVSPDSIRSLMGRSGRAGRGGAARGDMSAAFGRGGVGGLGSERSQSDSRPVVVFVLGPDSVPEPKLVHIGLNDWDRTEVVSGLEEGETLVVVGAAQLRARQEEWMNRMRERFGGSPLGGGGGRGGR